MGVERAVEPGRNVEAMRRAVWLSMFQHYLRARFS